MKLSLIHALAFGALAVPLVPAVAAAQEAPPPAAPAPVTTQETTSQATGPSMAMVASGLVLFGLSYVPAAVTSGASHLGADRTLAVPIAGPWIDLTQRPGCSPAGQCNTENTDKVLLVVDGILQGIGALTVIGGLLTTSHETKTVQTTAEPTKTFDVVPIRVGAGGYGMAAVGSF